MNGTSVSEFDNKQIELCPICLRKLITNISQKGYGIKNYNIKNYMVVYDKFIKLRDALENFSGLYENEVNWFNARIDFLKSLISIIYLNLYYLKKKNKYNTIILLNSNIKSIKR